MVSTQLELTFYFLLFSVEFPPIILVILHELSFSSDYLIILIFSLYFSFLFSCSSTLWFWYSFLSASSIFKECKHCICNKIQIEISTAILYLNKSFLSLSVVGRELCLNSCRGRIVEKREDEVGERKECEVEEREKQ